MPEIRFDAKDQTVSVIDGYCIATGRCRTSLINEILEQWAAQKLHEAILVCRTTGTNPLKQEDDRKC